MSYDPDAFTVTLDANGKSTKAPRGPMLDPRDLEAIITLIELAALELTTAPGESFTREKLIETIREYAGDDIKIEEKDVDNVLGKGGPLKKVPGGRFVLRDSGFFS